jgi:hypothetical protein
MIPKAQQEALKSRRVKARGVSYGGLAIFIKKYELRKFKYFTMQKYNLSKQPPKKETKSFEIS